MKITPELRDKIINFHNAEMIKVENTFRKYGKPVDFRHAAQVANEKTYVEFGLTVKDVIVDETPYH